MLKERHRLCDFCGYCTAVLYCTADSAKLCLSCDREVHSTNQLFTKHTRSLLCDACDSSPASIFCSMDAAVLCHTCHWESHSPALSPPHDCCPVEQFSGRPSLNELLFVLGFENVSKKSLLSGDDADNDEYLDYLVWDTPSGVDDYDVPLPKNQNAACGQHKADILCQLRDMLKLEPNFATEDEDFEPMRSFQSMEPKSTELKQKASGFQTSKFVEQGIASSLFGGFVETNCLVPDKDSDTGDGSVLANDHSKGQSQHSSITDTMQVLPRVAPRELNSQERETAITRYKEKRKTRRFEKQIRYESRKVRAESRARIKGRFAKKDQRDTAIHG
ncbi:PREDICTED: zinc finger protein CONSTANS-LIKE 13-like isoform X2 [Ipomoea nil]|uniref:zinc finger protein CONSTANS-LIKE 13-like isoform X2 n=1 Tax=Ipomoea nil TaxID=35883 RepID=UPI00090100DA|nr:PREDICTED: zinc finger protein CONSTANS-LIKE 13-like isoform X2 [Ipomoea nil]